MHFVWLIMEQFGANWISQAVGGWSLTVHAPKYFFHKIRFCHNLRSGLQSRCLLDPDESMYTNANAYLTHDCQHFCTIIPKLNNCIDNSNIYIKFILRIKIHSGNIIKLDKKNMTPKEKEYFES